MTRLSLREARERKDRGDVHLDSSAPDGPTFGPEFWEAAAVIEAEGPKPVLLKLEPEILDYFKGQGRGHITKMQNVLRAYVAAQKGRKAG